MNFLLTLFISPFTLISYSSCYCQLACFSVQDNADPLFVDLRSHGQFDVYLRQRQGVRGGSDPSLDFCYANVFDNVR